MSFFDAANELLEGVAMLTEMEQATEALVKVQGEMIAAQRQTIRILEDHLALLKQQNARLEAALGALCVAHAPVDAKTETLKEYAGEQAHPAFVHPTKCETCGNLLTAKQSQENAGFCSYACKEEGFGRSEATGQ